MMRTRRLRALLISMFAALMAVSAVPATASAVQAPAAMVAASTTKSCGTGGYWYQTDSMYVVRSWTGSQWKYTVTRSANRTVTQETSTTYHYWKHTARWLHVYYSSSSVKSISYPGNTTYIYSSSSGVDFRMVFELQVNGLYNSTRMCDVYF